MKKLIFVLLIISLAAFFFWPAKHDSGIYKYRRSLINRAALIGKSDVECRQELELKKEQLAAYEKAITDVDAIFERMDAEIPVCPRTGQKSSLRITEDPRPELRVKVEELQEEIAVLEGKVSGS